MLNTFSRIARAACFHLLPELLRPYRASLLVTKQCNLRCQMCNFGRPDTYRERKELTTDEWKSILDKLIRFGISEIAFQGGECLLRPDIAALVSYAKNDLHAYTTLTSNGILLEQKADCLPHVDRLIVSIDSLNPEIHNRIRGRDGLLQTVMSNIEKVKHLPGEINISSIIHRENVKDLEELITYAESHGFGINIFPLCEETVENSARAASAMRLLDIDNKQLYRDLKRILRKPGSLGNFFRIKFILERDLQIRNGNPPESIKNRRCNAMNNFLIVMFDGTIYPCCGNMPPMGNLLQDNLRRIWHSEQYRALRRLSRKGTHAVCGRCNHIETEYLIPEIAEELMARLHRFAKNFTGGSKRPRS